MYRQKNVAVIDIETNLSHSTIWMAGVYHPSSGTSTSCTTVEQLHTALCGVDAIIGHNLIWFDVPILKRVWGFSWNKEVIDTLTIARLLGPGNSLWENHKLGTLAKAAGGAMKEEFTDFDGGLTPEMEAYCLADCAANWDVYNYLMGVKDELGFDDYSIELEHQVSAITYQQQQNGFMLNFNHACEVYNGLQARMGEIEATLQETFPPIIHERWSEKTGKRLKDRVETFNVGSRQQVAKRLADKGAVWKNTTPTGKPMVDEKSLAENAKIPEAALVLEYLNAQKKSSMVKTWLDAYEDDGRVRGYVNTNGAVTGRMTHSKPNLAQVPKGGDYRSCFIVPEGHKLVGCDASQLELRLLAHYMQDPDYIKQFTDGDVHSANQRAFGCATRDLAKTLIYALLYGAGDEKLGKIVDRGVAQGRKLRRNFEQGLPAYAELKDKIEKLSAKGTLPGLDGRRIHVRSAHSALNALLQGAGAVVMKQALVYAVRRLDNKGLPYKIVAQVHDEIQLEVPEEHADAVGQVVADAIYRAGNRLSLRCPMAGEYKVADNWAGSH